jgi:hypothetical protein
MQAVSSLSPVLLVTLRPARGRDTFGDTVSTITCTVGTSQEYTMMDGGTVFGWPEKGYPAPQGPFYCGVGSESVYGRPLAEDHLDACIKAGLKISGINAEVMPGQWEFQIGPAGPLEMPDQVDSPWPRHAAVHQVLSGRSEQEPDQKCASHQSRRSVGGRTWRWHGGRRNGRDQRILSNGNVLARPAASHRR